MRTHNEWFFCNLNSLSYRWWSCCWTKGPTWVPSIRKRDNLFIVLLTWVSRFYFLVSVAPPLSYKNNKISNCGMALSGFPIGHVEVVKLLVSRSADKSCKDKQGYTPLHAAAASGHIEIVKYLLRMGAEVSGSASTFKRITWSCITEWERVTSRLLSSTISLSWMIHSFEGVQHPSSHRLIFYHFCVLLSDWWAQWIWKHSSPCGLLHGAGGGGYRAGQPRS